jgi:hypothetical protein
MNELTAPAKFLMRVIGVAIALGLFGYLGQLTYKMAEMAVEAQQHDQMSYGKFSRQLWSTPTKK